MVWVCIEAASTSIFKLKTDTFLLIRTRSKAKRRFSTLPSRFCFFFLQLNFSKLQKACLKKRKLGAPRCAHFWMVMAHKIEGGGGSIMKYIYLTCLNCIAKNSIDIYMPGCWMTCFTVMGMDWSEKHKCVAIHFKHTLKGASKMDVDYVGYKMTYTSVITIMWDLNVFGLERETHS